MGDVVRLTIGRSKPGKKLPKPIECKECGDPIETARVQALTSDPGTKSGILRVIRCWSCQSAWERRFDREMEGVRANQTVQIIR